jgi:serine/threonine protein kinase
MEQTLAEALCLPHSLRTPDYERYIVKGELGVGAMGRVLHAYDQKLSRDVAIKVTVADGDGDTQTEDLKARFYREAKIVAALRHPNVLQILDYSGPDAPIPFIVTELLEGIDLDTLIERGPIPESVAAAIAYHIAAGLQHAHGLGIVHRDVKAENIFIEKNGRVVIIDFGIAKGVRASSTRVTLMTSRTQILGTPLFSSPEQVRSNAAPTPATDLFSLGAVLFYSMSQVLPFPARSRAEFLDQLQNAAPVDLRRLVACSERCWNLIESLLQKAPEKRPATAEVVAGLKHLAHDKRFPTLEDAIATFINEQEAPKPEVTRIAPPVERTVIAAVPPAGAADPTVPPDTVVARVRRPKQRTKRASARSDERTAESNVRALMRRRRMLPILSFIALTALGLASWLALR